MNTQTSELGALKNIGPTIERRLNSVGIFTKKELERLGSVEAYKRIRDKYIYQTIPVCYYLYSLQGALLDTHWDDLPTNLKKDLEAKAR